jgi:hypothetical protein
MEKAMARFRRDKDLDENLAREFLVQVLGLGRTTASSLLEFLEKLKAPLPPEDDLATEVSLAVLGTSLAMLRGHSKIMDPVRAVEVGAWCKESVRQHCSAAGQVASQLVDAVDEYEQTVERAIRSSANPFSEVSGVLLIRAFGPRVGLICLQGTDTLNPFIHQIVGDVVTMATTQAMAFWQRD